MKRPVLLLAIGLALIAFAAVWRVRRSKSRHAIVPIQDGKTMDFSSGKVVVKNDPAEEAALKKSVAEMDAAAGNVTFAPRGNATAK